MKLSIIIPVYNEEKTVKELLKKIQQVKLDNVVKEIIIVDDNSEDKTKSIFKDVEFLNIIKLYHPYNQGKAAAIRTGLEQASGDMVLIQDGDLEYDPNDYPALLEPIMKNEADVVYGVRFFNNNSKFSLSYLLANKFLVWLTNVLYGSSLTDMETCYKLFKKDLLISLNVEAQGFEFEPEVTAKLLLRKHKIVEVPISYNARSRQMGKKINFFDGIMSIYTLFKYRFTKGVK